MQLELEQLVRALSSTVDLVGVDEVQHGKRVAYMSLRCGETMGFDEGEKTTCFRLGLLHDCGVSSTKVHKNLVNDLEWENSDHHCAVGAERVSGIDHLSSLAPPIRYHHSRWEELKDMDLPEDTKDRANLIFLLDRVDALVMGHPGKTRLAAADHIRYTVAKLKGSYFKPELVESFLQSAAAEEFWITMEPLHLEDYLRKKWQIQEQVTVSMEELQEIAQVFAQIVDAKSQYTAEHSTGVAAISRFLAESLGLDYETVQKVEVAGLLHDLGKLQVPDLILDLNGQLEDEDLTTMRHHSYVTFQILRRIKGLEDVTIWAANHHEKLDGSGYPFKKKAADLSLESRVVAVADIFQALAQNRPYRESQPLSQILSYLEKDAQNNKIDGDVVALVREHGSHCHRLATRPSQ